jgi:signal transduction histidine kinase
MNLSSLISQAAPPLLAADFTPLLRHEKSIYLVTAVCCLLFALFIFSLLHRASILRDKKWAQPFAITFLVLAAVYVLFIIQLNLYGSDGHYLTDPGNRAINIIVACFSGLTNYLFLLSGSRLWEPALTDMQQLTRLRRLGINPARVPSTIIGLLLLAVVLGVVWVFYPDRKWMTYPDYVFSSVALTFMGYALYKNSSRHRERLVGWVALLSALGYAVLYLLWFGWKLGYIVVPGLPGDVLVSFVSLPLKLGLLVSASWLMLLLFGPLQEIQHLHDDVALKQEEYLERGGFVKAVWNALPGRRVELFIKVPGSKWNEADGSKKYQVELLDYPSSRNGDQQEAHRLDYDESAFYARVMRSGTTVAEKQVKGHGWPSQHLQRPTRVGVPIYFHNSVIACLAVEIGDRDFTGTDRTKLERLATYISPAVQSYRELAALNRITENAAEHQIKLNVYDVDKDLGKITEIIHDVVSPLSTGISIQAGFDKYSSIYPQTGRLYEPTGRQLAAPPGKEVTSDVRVEHRWLKNGKGLTISKLDSSGRKIGEQVFGKFVFAADKESQRREHPTLGTNISSLLAVSNLLTSILLDFVRGHLNQLTDRLGARLSSLKVTTVADWFREVERTAREAKLLWAVVRYPNGDGRLLGGEAAVRLVEELECPSRKEKWEPKEDGFWLYSLDQPGDGTWHVIRRSLNDSSVAWRDSSATLWLGVARPDFGEELDYVSPWKYFLTHFWHIADSALLRLINDEQQKRRMGQVQSIIAGTLTVGTILHDIVNGARGLVRTIDNALAASTEDKTSHAALLSDVRVGRNNIEALLPKLTDIYKRDLRQPCPLDEVVERALDRVRHDKKMSLIKVDRDVPRGALINLPFDAAANALAIVIDNAKGAILQRLEEKKGGPGLIRIHAREMGDKFVCDISDNGPGVPPELRDKLLKEVCRSDKPNSHGVGLLFSVDLLRLYGGDIIPVQMEPKPYTTFSIHFPK